ncbi:hypothetical protein ACE38U_18200 [Cedecea sp. S5-13]|uniref:hypothetical protein n=1 Tax=Cedecea selenatireducens TaxID=3144416 RepID=UPI0035CD25D3
MPLIPAFSLEGRRGKPKVRRTKKIPSSFREREENQLVAEIKVNKETPLSLLGIVRKSRLVAKSQADKENPLSLSGIVRKNRLVAKNQANKENPFFFQGEGGKPACR